MAGHYSSRSDGRYDDRSSFRGNGGGGGGGGRFGGDSMSALGANLRNIDWDISKLPVFEKNFYIGDVQYSSIFVKFVKVCKI
jgi:ATP-dependent RNA helicase DDX5/DBP2